MGVVVLGVLECICLGNLIHVGSGFDGRGTEYWDSFCVSFTVSAHLLSGTRIIFNVLRYSAEITPAVCSLNGLF